MLAQLVNTHTCRKCGSRVRLIALTTNEHVVIDLEPTPDGRIIPWPNDRPSGITMGRVVDFLMDGEQGWSQHRCP